MLALVGASVLLLASMELVSAQSIMYAHGTGAGDASLHRNDDGYSAAIPLSSGFPFFGNVQTTAYVSAQEANEFIFLIT